MKEILLQTLPVFAILALLICSFIRINKSQQPFEELLRYTLLEFAKACGDSGFTYSEAFTFLSSSRQDHEKSKIISEVIHDFLHEEGSEKYIRFENSEPGNINRYFYISACDPQSMAKNSKIRNDIEEILNTEGFQKTFKLEELIVALKEKNPDMSSRKLRNIILDYIDDYIEEFRLLVDSPESTFQYSPKVG